MPEKDEMLAQIKREIAHRNLSVRGLARMTGMSHVTIAAALRGEEFTRRSTLNLLYLELIPERDSNGTEAQASA